MKFDFKKIIRIAFTLMLVAGLSGVLIVLLNNYVTAERIAQNEIDKENKALEAIYSNCDYEVLEENSSNSILKITKATKSNEFMGYIYKVTGKNAYGTITLMLGIDPSGVVSNIVMIENTESFKSTVDEHFEANYKEDDMNQDYINGIDTKCGATYGAKLLKSLVSDALTHYNENYGG